MVNIFFDFIFNHHFPYRMIHLGRSANINLSQISFFHMSINICIEIILLQADVCKLIFCNLLVFLNSHRWRKIQYFLRLTKWIDLIKGQCRKFQCILCGTVEYEFSFFDEVFGNQRIVLGQRVWQAGRLEKLGSLEQQVYEIAERKDAGSTADDDDFSFGRDLIEFHACAHRLG